MLLQICEVPCCNVHNLSLTCLLLVYFFRSVKLFVHYLFLDRDSYVKILWDNIMTGMEYNFLK